MASLVLFRRRWHIASDVIPLVAFLLALQHLVWFCLYVAGTVSLERSGLDPDCNAKVVLRVANYSLLVLFALLSALEFALVGVGLRGGPMELRKRYAVAPLLYIELVLWAALFCFTIYATYVVATPSIGAGCWENNPCAQSGEEWQIKDYTKCSMPDGSKVPTLSPQCREVFELQPQFLYCYGLWYAYGDHRNASTPCPDVPPRQYSRSQILALTQNGTVAGNLTAVFQGRYLDTLGLPHGSGNVSQSAPWFKCFNQTCKALLRDGDQCTQFDVVLAIQLPQGSNEREYFQALVYSNWAVLGLTVLVAYLCYNSCPDYSDLDSWENTLKGMADTCCCGSQLEQASGGTGDPASREIARSLYMLFGGIDLDPSDRLLGMYLVSEQQSARRQRHAAQALVAAGFAQLPGQPGMVRRAFRRLARAVASRKKQQPEVSLPSSPEFAKPSEIELKGAGDSSLDPPAPAMLAGPQQQPAAQPLPAAGCVGPSEELARSASSAGGAPAMPVSAFAVAPSTVSLPAAVLGFGGGEAEPPTPAGPHPSTSLPVLTGRAQSEFSPFVSPFEGTSLLPGGSIAASISLPPPSPFGSSTAASTPHVSEQPQQPPIPAHRLQPVYRYSFLRLKTGLSKNIAEAAGALGKVQLRRQQRQQERQAQQQGQHGKAANSGQQQAQLLNGRSEEGKSKGPEAEVSPESPVGAGGTETGALHSADNGLAAPGGEGGVGEEKQGVRIRLKQRYHPMLTPSGWAKKLPITPQQAASIYTGLHDAVPVSELKEAQRIFPFAYASYGLQSIIWNKGRKAPMCMGNLNMLVKCLNKTARLESKFRRRNYRAIVEVTGVHPCDLVYVSYANAPGGVLPYMFMLHRPSKSLVLAVRGTVSMEDLITDLLSRPADVSGWMPDWVAEEAGGGEGLLAHEGIVGSATAILKDLEERGILKELLYSQLCEGDACCAASASGSGGKGLAAMRALKLASLGAKLTFWHKQQARQRRIDSGCPAEQLDALEKDLEAGGGCGKAVHDDDDDEEEMVRLPLRRAQTIIRNRLQTEGWQVVVTGHSLGAAVACLLSFHLRDIFPDLKCWAFNPPGGLLSWRLSRLSQRFCTSIVVGKDVISRLSFSTSKRLVDEMVTSLARCKRPKLAVLADLVLKRRAPPVARTFCTYEDICDEAVEALEGYHASSVLHRQAVVEMYPPGRLAFLRPFKGRAPHQAVWDAVWVEAAALMGEGILVSPAMMAHHRVFVTAAALRSALAGEVDEAVHGVTDDNEAHLERYEPWEPSAEEK